MLKMVAPRFGAVYIVAVRSVTSLLFALVVAAAVGIVDSLGTLAMFTVILLIASGSAAIVGHVSFVKALSIDQISRVFPTTNGLYIMFSVVGTIIISNESVTWRTVGGGLLVLGGIYMLSVRRQQEATRQTEGGFKLLALVLSAVTGLTWAVSVIVQNDIVEHTNPILANAIRHAAIMVIGLTMDRKALYQRIDDRVDSMMESGFLAEVERLAQAGYPMGHGALDSPGYRELGLYINGELSLEESVSRTKTQTHRLARRQYTWFKLSDPRIQWLDAAGSGVAEQASELLSAYLSETNPVVQ